jgi:hypothetical protein
MQSPLAAKRSLLGYRLLDRKLLTLESPVFDPCPRASVATVGELVSVYAPTPLIQFTPDVK